MRRILLAFVCAVLAVPAAAGPAPAAAKRQVTLSAKAWSTQVESSAWDYAISGVLRAPATKTMNAARVSNGVIKYTATRTDTGQVYRTGTVRTVKDGFYRLAGTGLPASTTFRIWYPGSAKFLKSRVLRLSVAIVPAASSGGLSDSQRELNHIATQMTRLSAMSTGN